MTGGIGEAVRRIVEQGDDADEILRAAVEALAAAPDVTWAAIAFTENGSLGVGPCSGEPDEAHRSRTPISFEGAMVGELWVDGEAPQSELDAITSLLAPYVLIGWDTSGEIWEP